MKRLLLFCAGWPLITAAQEVKPVLSSEYLALIHTDSALIAKGKLTDSTNNMRNASLRYTASYVYTQLSIKSIRVNKNNELVLKPIQQRSVLFAGSASVTMGIQQPNRQPATQQEFVQGRSAGGILQWRGPETGEQFSFGPSIHTLMYDGNAYPYDINGRLVPVTGGEGGENKARPYDNSALRNGAYASQAVTLFTRYRKNYTNIFNSTLRAAQGREQTIIRGNNNKTDNFSASADGILQQFNLSGSYSYRQERSSHNNRNGFLNRVYQNSLTSPVSFATRQGTVLNGGQRSYSNEADNPLFLLDDKGHAFTQQQQTIQFAAERKFDVVKIRLAQSLDLRRQLSREGYQPGTAFFPSGINLQRSTRDRNYWLNSNITWSIKHENSYKFRSQAQLNYQFINNHSAIDYSIAHKDYRYHRSLHELSLSYSTDYNYDDVEAGLLVHNKFYLSSTASKKSFFLPGISASVQQYELFGLYRLRGKFFASCNYFTNELPLSSSFAGYSLLQFNSANALQYLPVDEVNSFNNLSPIRHREFNTGMELSFYNRVNFTANWYLRHTNDDIIPILAAGGGFSLQNIAAYRNQGIELQLSNDPWIFKTRRFGMGNTISFVSNRNKVTAVKEGYNYTPIAGFSNVHKTLVLGQPLGIITGSRWLRNENGQVIIGNDGFPLANPTPGIIGDPTPDFTIKFNQYFTLKSKWELRIDWQWNKGGDIWNGTQALLDYLGRSAGSGEQRGITGYVFNGVQANGSHNTIPVSFYDPSQPVEQNRWVRYGPGGVAEDYIHSASNIRIQNISITFKPVMRKKIKELAFTLHAGNIMLWSAYKGADPNQLLYDMPGATGLDFFNLPAVRTFGFSSSIQF
jgi:hypothetical protein